MRIILNGINGRYLREITDNAAQETELVEAAVAYATEEDLLFAWCWEKEIPLRYWGRFDETIPVSLHILRLFLQRRSPNFVCKLLTHFHAKVIWWHGVGAYIGSANLTNQAWYQNIEAGCFFEEAEMVASGMDEQLRAFFTRVDEIASPLNDELFKAIEAREKELRRLYMEDAPRGKAFNTIPSMRQWSGLARVATGTVHERQRQNFVDEWFATLQILRDIAARVSRDENRPRWVPHDVPSGAQADQFLHAFYYNNVFGADRRSLYVERHEANRTNPAQALSDAIKWWRDLSVPPSNEDRTLLEWAPFLREMLSRDQILGLTEDDFVEICRRVWSIQDHARRVSNATLNLPGDRRHDMMTKTNALAAFLFSRRSKNSSSVLQVVHRVLYDGSDEQLPMRLWESIAKDDWRIEHLGISALGELVGWALPNRFPPRNNRTSKALYSLGFNVAVHGA